MRINESINIEVNNLPKDWSFIKIGDIFSFKNGLNKEKKFFGYGTPIVNYMDVYKLRGIKANDIKGKVFLSKQEIKNYEVQKGDVFFTRTSETVEEIGISSVILEDLIDSVFSGFVLRGRPIKDHLDIMFCQYCFASDLVRKQIFTTASYTTRALTNGRLLSDIKLPIPPTIEEQKAIATALNDTDDLIAKLEKLIEKKKAIKQGAMQELLKPKEEWEMKFLGEYIKFQVGFPFSSKYFNKKGDGLRLIKNRDLKSDDNINFFSFTYLHDYIINNGDILIGMDGDFLPCLWTKGMALLNQRVGRLMPYKEIDKIFLYYYLVEPLKEIENRTSSTTVKHLSHKDIEGFFIPLPEVEEQNRIAEILSDMDSEIEALEKKLEKLQNLKQGMMQNLLTGKIRLI